MKKHGPSRRVSTSVVLVILLTAAVATVAAVGFGGGSRRETALPASVATTGAAPPTAAATPSQPTASASHSSPLVAELPSTYPNRGEGTYTYATGGTERFGTGKLKRYKVAVENGIGITPALFAAEVDAVLDNTGAGWSAGGLWSFQRVSSGPVAFTVYLASPHTTYEFCEKLIGQDVRESAPGGVNCSNNGNTVVENVARWIDLSTYYQGQPDVYHALAIDHEVGHSLGHGHVSCPGRGEPAPVMMQQIKGLHGCVPNGWPYTSEGAYITGPSSP